MSLRAILTLASAVLLLVALTCALALARLTSQQHRMTRELARISEKARLSGELRFGLLRARDLARGKERDRLEARMQSDVQALGGLVRTPEGRQLAEQAGHAISQYLQIAGVDLGADDARTKGELEKALGTLEDIIARSDAQADDALAQVARWDDISDRIAAAIAATLLLGVAAQLVWLWRGAFRPLSEVAAAMRRFAAGERSARAAVRGPQEARQIANGFNEMADALAEEQERRMAFVGGIAHDLRGPISAMRLGAAALSRSPEMPSKQALGRYLDLAERQGLRLERMVGDFLDRVRVEAGQLELRREVCDAREVAREAARPFEGLSPAHPVRVSVGPEPVPLRCDRGRIEQVLANLLSNAIKYSPHGGEVELRVEASGGLASLNVTDHGLGIGAADLQKLFQPFRRVGEHRSIPGVGLGLYVSRRIVAAHGGSLVAESAVGRGSRFGVRLPLAVGAEEGRYEGAGTPG